MSDFETRKHRILSALNDVRENLMVLSDDIWHNIDHNDPEELEKGFKFKQAYNEKRNAFDKLAEELSRLIQEYPQVQLKQESQEKRVSKPADEIPIEKELDAEAQHSIDEDFTHKRPFGFVLQEQAFTGLSSWVLLYHTFLDEVAKQDKKKFSQLPENQAFRSQSGNKIFSRNAQDVQKALAMKEGVYAEGNLSANLIIENIKKLLSEFSIPPDSLKVLLREETRGVIESKVLAPK